jgi:hypothetical protein
VTSVGSKTAGTATSLRCVDRAVVLKLTHRPKVVEDYRRAGVVSASGLIAYFALALAFHVRAKDTANAVTPVVLMVLAAAALGLRLTTL